MDRAIPAPGPQLRRAYLNSLLKPLAVGVVKQRDILQQPLPDAPALPAAAPARSEISARRPVVMH